MTRADLVNFLTPLGGCILVCDCERDVYCHGHTLIDTFTSVIVDESVEGLEQSKLDAMSVACVMEGFDEDDEEGIVAAAEDSEVAPPPRFNAETEAVNETVRSGAANVLSLIHI